MSPISEKLYEGPATEYYRRYKGPLRRSRSFHDVRPAPRGYSQTMDELNTRDLNQTTLPVDLDLHYVLGDMPKKVNVSVLVAKLFPQFPQF